jgi:hypothetical protein
MGKRIHSNDIKGKNDKQYVKLQNNLNIDFYGLF